MAATPVADEYLQASRRGADQPLFGLDLWQCAECGHVQLLDVVNPEVLFGNYTYTTAVSLGLTEHFSRYAAEMIARTRMQSGSLVVEIGSNDGTLLRFFQQQGMRVCGVDPARAIAARATASGIATMPAFFTRDAARDIRAEHGPAALVAANNVFAHADDLGGIVDGIRELLAADGVFVFEVSYLVDIVEKGLFDTVYHEHLCYHSIKPLQRFFRTRGLDLVDVQRIPSKGGSFRGFAMHQGAQSPEPVVDNLVQLEESIGLDTPRPFEVLHQRLQTAKAELLASVDSLRASGATIAGYGASATVTTFTHYFDLGGRLAYLVDDNPAKHGTLSPGHQLEVYSSDVLYERRPDYVLVLAWPYAEPILRRHGRFVAEGGRFIIPFPQLRIVEHPTR